MKKLLFLLLLVVPALLVNAQEAPEGLFINSKAPDFKWKDKDGKSVRLRDYLKKGPVVLVFYRGQWCPSCNRHLKMLQDSLELIKGKGAQVIAVTPETPENIEKTVGKTGASFPIVHDEDLKIMKAYEVEFEVPENTLTRYRNTGIKLEENNGKNGNFLPVPATYIIDKEGNITYRFFNPDYKKRPSLKELLANIK